MNIQTNGFRKNDLAQHVNQIQTVIFENAISTHILDKLPFTMFWFIKFSFYQFETLCMNVENKFVHVFHYLEMERIEQKIFGGM
jgi:hypothetical protein